MSNQKSGWVYKQGGVTGNAWNKKYAVLQYNLLLVFDSEEDAAKKAKPKSTYNLSDCIVRPAEGMHKFGFQLQLSNNDKKQVNLAALDSQSLTDWTDKIKEVAKPAPVVKAEERKLPGRWDPPAQPKPAVAPSHPGGNVAVQQPSPVMAQQQPVMNYAQPQQMPMQQVPAQQAPPQQGPPQYNYNQYMGQYQPQVQYQGQYQQPQQYQAQPQQYQQPQYQQPQYQQPQQYQGQPQYQQPQYQQPQYQQPQYQQQQYQQPQYQQPQQPTHSQQLNQLISQAPVAPTSAPVAFPSTPTEQPKTQTTSQSSMFPHLSQLQQ